MAVGRREGLWTKRVGSARCQFDYGLLVWVCKGLNECSWVLSYYIFSHAGIQRQHKRDGKR